MTGRVTKSDQKGRGVDQLAERRRHHGQSNGDATRETEAPQGPEGVSGPQLVPPPPPTPYSLTSALFDDDPVDETAVVSSADEILDALPSQPDEDDAVAAGVDLDEDEISVQLHRHHERAHQTTTGRQIPRGSAQLTAAAPAARRVRVPGSASARHRESAGRSQAAATSRRTGRALLVAGLVSVTALGAVLTLVITGSSPHTNTQKAGSDAAARSALSAVATAPTAALYHQLLTLVSATTTVGKTVEHQAQQRAQLARTRTADRTVRTRKRADAQRRHAAAVAPPASPLPPVTSTTVAASTPRASSNAPSTTETPTTPSVSEGASSTTGSTNEASTSTGGSTTPAAAGPTGVGSAVGCSPKCTPH